MNMMLFTEAELASGLPANDRRAVHVRKVLKKGPGEFILAGQVDGSVGAARIEALDDEGLRFSFCPHGLAEALWPLELLLAFPRPIQANRIFKDLTSIGLRRIILCGSELGEKSYIQSNFFKNDLYQAALIEGAEQAGNPRLPQVDKAWTLDQALDRLDGSGRRIVLDPRGQLPLSALLAAQPQAEQPQAEQPQAEQPRAEQPAITLAIGSERGWTAQELLRLEAAGFEVAHLGSRILKSETACLLASGLALAAMGRL